MRHGKRFHFVLFDKIYSFMDAFCNSVERMFCSHRQSDKIIRLNAIEKKNEILTTSPAENFETMIITSLFSAFEPVHVINLYIIIELYSRVHFKERFNLQLADATLFAGFELKT